jgi:hypothetical protein
LKKEFLDAGDPVFSIDTKKKELIGNFYRDGKLYPLFLTTIEFFVALGDAPAPFCW